MFMGEGGPFQNCYPGVADIGVTIEHVYRPACCIVNLMTALLNLINHNSNLFMFFLHFDGHDRIVSVPGRPRHMSL